MNEFYINEVFQSGKRRRAFTRSPTIFSVIIFDVKLLVFGFVTTRPGWRETKTKRQGEIESDRDR